LRVTHAVVNVNVLEDVDLRGFAGKTRASKAKMSNPPARRQRSWIADVRFAGGDT
jgi:hypothetical protein